MIWLFHFILLPFTVTVSAPKQKYYNTELTEPPLFDRFEVKGAIVKDFTDNFKDDHNLEITMFSECRLYSFFLQSLKDQKYCAYR